ncbi:hypothetical protein [Pseudolactococcus raffinolactis]|uniref:hypothetical protein n=1 Tax=Pseudolactococcus raffinolactis TaxID=1366 RepID=UPI0014368027|nr:hypothetical protein [Lactococcus raffinolactis]QIW51736.1 hypothetical protein GU337_07540 [Lactococcus raffinolactis]
MEGTKLVVIKDYRREFLNLNSSKFSKEKSVSIFIGTIFLLLTDKEIFKKNIDIRDFLKVILKKEYKDYLFKSRPYLSARVLNDITKEMSYHEIINTAMNIAEYLEQDIYIKQDTSNKRLKNRPEENIIGWVNQIHDDKSL